MCVELLKDITIYFCGFGFIYNSYVLCIFLVFEDYDFKNTKRGHLYFMEVIQKTNKTHSKVKSLPIFTSAIIVELLYPPFKILYFKI